MSDNKINTRFRFDPFVQQVKSDPLAGNGTILLSGYIGEGIDGKVRIYPDASLNDYIEVAKSDIVHAVANSPAENALGGSRIWIKKEAQLILGSGLFETRTKEEYTQGELVNFFRTRMFEGGANSVLKAISPGATPFLWEKARTAGCYQTTRR